MYFVGYYCRSGAYISTPEFFNNTKVNLTSSNSTNCTFTCPECQCPVGTFNKTDAGPCPTGSYCPEGTDEPKPCPEGTFNKETKIQSESQCQNCTAGSYCGSQNLSNPSGECWAGYFCPLGSKLATAKDCPPGQYCINGSSEAEDCPIGTYRNMTKGKSLDDCFVCPGGQYCQTKGLHLPNGYCDPGYVLSFSLVPKRLL